MSKDDTNTDAPQNDLPIDGGEMTPAEKEQAALLENEGSGDGTDAAVADTADPADPAAAAAAEPAPTPAPAPAESAAAAAETEAEAAAAAAPAPASVVVQDPKPEPAKDWDKEMDALAAKFDLGEIDTGAYQKELRRLMVEQTDFTTDLRLWTDRQTRAAAEAEAEFSTAALAWERANATFMANPLRAKAMQDAINAIGTAHPELTPSALFTKAAAVAFEAFNFTVPGAAPADPADKDKIAAAVAGRRAGAAAAPATLANAPAAAQFDPSKSSFSQLDELGIDDMENALARLPPDKVEQFLADAPGATSRGE